MSHGVARLEPRREVLDNGIVLLWNRWRDTPTVSVRGSLSAGACREAPEQEGLAGFAARLLRRGTVRHTARRISELVEDVGASFSVWAGTEEAGFSARCLARDLGIVLDALREVLEEPAFPHREVERVRAETYTQIRDRDDSTRARAELAVYQALYPPDHPYSRSALGTRETIDRLTREDLAQFHREHYSPEGLMIALAGAVEPELARRHLEQWLPGRPASAPLPDWSGPAFGAPRETRVAMAHKSQVDLVLAGPGLARSHPDYHALSMVNLVLGGFGLMGRLGAVIREQHGLAYHASCRAASRLWAGEWLATAGVAPRHVDQTADAIRREVERIREELVTEEELADARDYLIGSMPLRLETSDGIASYLLSCEYYGLGLDYVERYPGYVRSETRESLRAAARRYMDPEGFSLAAAGPLD